MSVRAREWKIGGRGGGKECEEGKVVDLPFHVALGSDAVVGLYVIV